MQRMNELIKKAWAVINSCETPTHARAALRYVELLSIQYPELDCSGLRREIYTLFEFK